MKSKIHKISVIERVKKLRVRGIFDPHIERLAIMFKKFKKQQELKK
jgi:hypothetical protein